LRGVGRFSNSALFAVQTLQNRLQNFPNIGSDDFMTLGSWVNAIGQIQFANAADVIKNKRDEQSIVLFRQFRVDRGEFCSIIRLDLP